MKKLLTLFIATTSIAACSSAKTKSSNNLAQGSIKSVNGTFEESKEMSDKISKFKKSLTGFNSDTPVATDNLAIAELLVSIGANLIALPEFSDELESSTIKFGTQTFESREYLCGVFANQSYKKEDGKVVCYIDGKKSTTVMPVKTTKYGPKDTKNFFNLGFANKIDKEQLKKSGAKLFISTSDDVVSTKVSGIKNIDFKHLSSAEDLYLFMQTIGKGLGSNQSFVEKQMEDLSKVYLTAQSNQKEVTKTPSIQFVYTTSDGKVYGSTKESFGYKLGQRFGFDSSIKVADSEKHSFSEEIFTKSYGKEITKSSELTADVIFVMVSSKWGVSSAKNNVPTSILESKAYKTDSVLFLEDSQFISENTSDSIEKVISKVFDN